MLMLGPFRWTMRHMSIFTSFAVLGYENDPILGPTGAVAIPEFNTRFTRQMLEDTQPTDFNTLVRLSGFSHGTDVGWATPGI